MQHLILVVLSITVLFAACSGSDQAEQREQSSSQTAQTAADSADTQERDDSQTRTAQRVQQSTQESDEATDAGQQEQADVRTVSRSEESDAEQQSQATAAQEQSDEAGAVAERRSDEQAAQEQAEAEQTASEQRQTEAQADSDEQSESEPAEEQQQEAQEMQPEEDQDDSEPEPKRSSSEAEQLRLRAEEIAADATVADITGIVRWLNGAETSIALELAKGNVVLIDFWTYTCINCIRTLPFLTEWHDKYADYGLVIIGVHTPEFEFEKDPDNVRAAIEQYGIQYRVPQDDNFRTWRAFNNRYWPAKYLIGPTMDVRYLHFGEGDYDGTEVAIREALIDTGRDISHIPFGTTAVEPQRDPDRGRQTRELYGGTYRNYGRVQYAAQGEYYLQANADTFYEDIDTSREQREHHKWYLQGLWRNEPEAIVHARETQNLEDYLAFDFQARTVNVVVTVAEDGEPFDVFIELDGRWLRRDEAGDHVRWDSDGRSYIRVTVNDLYRLVKLEEWGKHELKLRSNSDQLQIFAFTFGSYLGGE